MRDHHYWRPNWHYSELHDLEAYDREERRHAWAAFYGTLTAVACAFGILYLMG